MRPALHRDFGLFLWLCLGTTILVTTLRNDAIAQTASIEDDRAVLKDWSRGTTLLTDGLITFLRNYRDFLAKSMGVKVPGLTQAMAKRTGDALGAKLKAAQEYERQAEKAGADASYDPRSVNPRVRAKFGTVHLSGENSHTVADALQEGTQFRDKILDAAFDAAKAGHDALDDSKVQALIMDYIQHRQAVTNALSREVERRATAGPADDAAITPIRWVAIVLVFLVLAFLMFAFFRLDTLSTGQRMILRFLMAMCAGGAGGIFTGTAVVQLNWQVPGGTGAISGAAGMALFLIVLLVFRGVEPDVSNPPQTTGKLRVVLPHGVSFGNAAKTWAAVGKTTVDFVGFEDKELNAEVQEQELDLTSLADGFLALRNLVKDRGAVRKYGVRKKDSIFYLTVK
jgi:hypothetical protein